MGLSRVTPPREAHRQRGSAEADSPHEGEAHQGDSSWKSSLVKNKRIWQALESISWQDVPVDLGGEE